jgi:hypothetical protein
MYVPNDFEIIGTLDVSELCRQVLLVPQDVWDQDFRKLENSNFGQSFSIHLRLMPFTLDKYFHVYNNVVTYKQDFLTAECNRIHTEIENMLGGYIVKSVIIKLDPNKNVEMHLDGDARIFKEWHRFIIPIITNENAYMLYEDRKYHLKEGIIYDTNTFIPHGTFNEGTESRYHMVLDLIFKTNFDNKSPEFFGIVNTALSPKLTELSKGSSIIFLPKFV